MAMKRALIAPVVLLGAALLAAAPALPANAATAATATINATAGLGTIPAGAIGLDTAVYDGDMNDAAIPPLLKAAGIDALRYPGGSYSDIYNWQTQTAVDGGYVAPNTSFANFMTTANAAAAKPIITVNYGTGTPSLAAAWVTAAASDSVGYWEVGNEVYGNGTYGANWETDAHCETSLNGPAVTVGSEPSQTYDCGPTQYAANVAQFESAMHAANPNAKVCAVVTTPGFWPDGVTNSEYPQSWNQTVLTALGSQTQCVIVHYYPGGSTTAGMLTDPSDIAGIVSTLHSEISQYAGISNAASVPVDRDRDQLHDRHGHPARGAVRRGHGHDVAGERRRHGGLVGRAQRRRHGQHRRRRHRLRRPGDVLQQQQLRRQHTSRRPIRRSRPTTGSRCCPSWRRRATPWSPPPRASRC